MERSEMELCCTTFFLYRTTENFDTYVYPLCLRNLSDYKIPYSAALQWWCGHEHNATWSQVEECKY